MDKIPSKNAGETEGEYFRRLRKLYCKFYSVGVSNNLASQTVKAYKEKYRKELEIELKNEFGIQQTYLTDSISSHIDGYNHKPPKKTIQTNIKKKYQYRCPNCNYRYITEKTKKCPKCKAILD
jgi:rubrerythrin